MNQITTEQKEQILDYIKQAVDKEQFASWFKQVDFIGMADGVIEIPLPNIYYQEWYEKNYKDILERAISQVLGGPHPIRFNILAGSNQDAHLPGNSPTQSAGTGDQKPGISTQAPSPKPQVTRPRPQLNERYIFERFVVGSCNRLAHATALGVAQNPAKAYNPLFIHGAVGLGKTHLLQAICHLALEKHPQTNLYYLSCEGFVNDFISAVKTGAYEAFRNRYRSVDILVIDDIHFLGVGAKHGSQEEFFHTFNALHNAQKQIILSSDSPPKDIPTLAERLVSRFKWGMVVRLDPPDFETRAAILKKKAELNNVPVSDEVINFIATSIDTNIRDLEGAIIKLIGFARVNSRPIDIELAQEALKDTIESRRYPITINDIQDVVSQYFKITIPDLLSKRRVKSISLPRQIGIYLARTLTTYSLEEIGAAFGGKDHTTVMYAVERIKHRVHKDRNFKTTLDFLLSELKKKPA